MAFALGGAAVDARSESVAPNIELGHGITAYTMRPVGQHMDGYIGSRVNLPQHMVALPNGTIMRPLMRIDWSVHPFPAPAANMCQHFGTVLMPVAGGGTLATLHSGFDGPVADFGVMRDVSAQPRLIVTPDLDIVFEFTDPASGRTLLVRDCSTYGGESLWVATEGSYRAAVVRASATIPHAAAALSFARR